MRVTLIGPLPPPHGGIAAHVERMCGHLGERGHEVHVLCPFSSSRPGHIKTHLLHLPFVLWRREHRALRHWHLTDRRRLLVMSICERLLPGSSIYTMHQDLDRLGMPAGLLRWILKPLDLVVCVKEADSRRMRDLCLHPNVVTLPAYLPELRQATGEPELASWLAGRERGLLFMASHWRQVEEGPIYGLDLLLQALAPLVETHPGLGLLALVPGGPIPADQRAVMQPWLDRLGDHVRVVDRPVDLQAVLPSAWLFVRPTRTDGDAMSLREAAALGVPCLASDCVERPMTCHLFRSGSVASLQAALEACLLPGGVEIPPRLPQASCLDPLLEHYQRLAGASG